MTTDRGRNERHGPEQCPGSASAGSRHRPAVPGPGREPDYNAFLESGGAEHRADAPGHHAQEEAENLTRRRRAATDEVIRVLRNVAALAVFSSTALALVAFAGVRMGVPPEFCLVIGLGGASLTVRALVKIFETVRPSMLDGPGGPPSSGGP